MPMYALKVPAGPNQFFSAVSLSLLLPALRDEAIFDDTVEHLFGTIAGRFQRILMSELKSYTLDTMPPSLNGFINSHLRPKLADYIVANKADYLALFDSEASLMAAVEKIRSGAEFLGALEERALAAMLRLPLTKHASEIVIVPGAPAFGHVLHLVSISEQYQALLNPDEVTEVLREQLVARLTTPVGSTAVVDREALLKRAELKRLSKATLAMIPSYLDTLSAIMPKLPEGDKNPFKEGDKNPFESVDPADARYSLRFDAYRESGVLRSDLARVPVAPAYDICEESLADGCTDEHRLYITLKADGFDYKLFKDKLLWSGSMTYRELELSGTITLESLRPVLPRILAITEERGHTEAASIAIGDLTSWGVSLGKSALVGASVGSTAGLATVGVVTLASGAGLAAGAVVAALPIVGLPVAAVTLVTILGTAAFGKHFAVQYEKVLNTAHRQVREGRFKEAADALDQEFGRFLVTRAFRSLFLTHQHHALAHFFRGMCAEGLGNYALAFSEYQKACLSAGKVAKSLTALVAKLQLLKLLREKSAKELVVIDKEAAIERLLVEVSKDYGEGLTNFYWRAKKVISKMARRFSLTDAPTLDERDFASRFLVADGFFILKHFANDRGLLVDIFSIFFQGLILTYFEHTNPAYLDEAIKEKLVKEFFLGGTGDESSPINLATKKFEQCIGLLRAFKASHDALIRANPSIAEGIRLMETFMIYFHLLSGKGLHSSVDDIVRFMSIERPRVALLSDEVKTTIGFMAQLQEDFGVPYETVEAWVDALLQKPSPVAHLISSRTGDTMLHALARLAKTESTDVTARVKEAATLLMPYRYQRNHEHKTPVLLLGPDAYGIKALLDREDLVKIGDSLDRVEDFLQRIRARPDIDSHFLLLDGPPGTGKTSSVLSHLKAKGYAVTEWVRGTDADRFVGGLVTRIGSFFGDAKRKAERSGVLQILFIDEIDAVIPLVSGTPTAGHHNPYEDITAFQTAITSLAGQRVVLIGATNYPEQLPKPIIERAGTNRIYFPLPDERQRYALLEYLLRHKEVGALSIARLAAVSIGYSPRQLRSFVETIGEKKVTSELMMRSFYAYADRLRRDFKAEFSCAELFMPSFEKEGEVESLFSSNPELREQLRRLQSRTAADPRMHTLLYGPPGGGKTTAVRVFAQKSGQVLLSIRADVRTSAEVLAKLFSRAKQFGRAIIFFDEMDRVACSGSPHTGFLQTEMDGMIANELTIIGATNYQERFEAAISSRFTSKILMPTLTRAQLGKPIRASLLDGVRTYGAPMYFDGELAAAMAEDSTRLGDEGSGLDLRSVHATLAYLMGDLTRERGSHAGITYLRLQDVCFAFYRMKIQEGLVARPAAGVPTSMVYIQTHRHSLFPAGALPEGSVDGSRWVAAEAAPLR